MAPSRGLNLLLLSRTRIPSSSTHLHWRTYSSSSAFTQHASSPTSKTQIYISRSLSPYLNLSIEHYLLQKTPEDSTILFLYTNAHSVIIGRNQNPWTEVNLAALNQEKWDLVRRRSGGGTVFHDEGNVNYSVICPSKVFDRDKHAEMVVRALKSLGVDNARVNCRHDIVVDLKEGAEDKTFKVSGSAYKLTRLRSLHHGTCLLNSSNLGFASKLLRSRGKPWITARGVESVRSPITNVAVTNEDFEDAVVGEFKSLYGVGEDVSVTIVGEEETKIPEIAKGIKELKSEDWIYDQTPQFTFTTEIADRAETVEGALLPETFSADLTIRHGKITDSSFKLKDSTDVQEESITSSLHDRPLRSIRNWEDEFSFIPPNKQSNPGKALNSIFGNLSIE